MIDEREARAQELVTEVGKAAAAHGLSVDLEIEWPEPGASRCRITGNISWSNAVQAPGTDQVDNRQPIDLSTPRLVTEDEVARLLNISVRALRYRISAGKFPITPKTTRPRQWSSVEVRTWIEDARKRAIY